MNSVPYVHDSKHWRQEDPPRDILRVKIEPQTHEMVLPAEDLWSQANKMNLPPQDAAPVVMIGLLRGQAREAYDAVMRGGLSAMRGRAMERDEVETEMRHYVEEAARVVEKVEAESKRWRELAERRGIEINALERAIARRSDV